MAGQAQRDGSAATGAAEGEDGYRVPAQAVVKVPSSWLQWLHPDGRQNRPRKTAWRRSFWCNDWRRLMTSDSIPGSDGLTPPADPRLVFERFSRQLIGLARGHLAAQLQHKVDPEDVVQSAYKSLLLRYGDGALADEGWEGLWGLLTMITVRKCADRARFHQAERRDVRREAVASDDSSSDSWREALSREPTPDQAAVLAEIVEGLLSRWTPMNVQMVELSLQGFSTQEISEQTGRAERSVRRLRERVRKYLERQHGQAAVQRNCEPAEHSPSPTTALVAKMAAWTPTAPSSASPRPTRSATRPGRGCEHVIREFEQAWREGPPPQIIDYVWQAQAERRHGPAPRAGARRSGVSRQDRRSERADRSLSGSLSRTWRTIPNAVLDLIAAGIRVPAAAGSRTSAPTSTTAVFPTFGRQIAERLQLADRTLGGMLARRAMPQPSMCPGYQIVAEARPRRHGRRLSGAASRRLGAACGAQVRAAGTRRRRPCSCSGSSARHKRRRRSIIRTSAPSTRSASTTAGRSSCWSSSRDKR